VASANESRRASIYWRHDVAFVVSADRDVHGVHRDGSWFARLDRPVAAASLGEAVLGALAASRDGVPARLYVRGVKQPPGAFLQFTGFKSWNALERGARYFTIAAEQEYVRITPSVAGPTGGFLHQPDRDVECVASAGAIGAAVMALVADATTR